MKRIAIVIIIMAIGVLIMNSIALAELLEPEPITYNATLPVYITPIPVEVLQEPILPIEQPIYETSIQIHIPVSCPVLKPWDCVQGTGGWQLKYFTRDCLNGEFVWDCVQNTWSEQELFYEHMYNRPSQHSREVGP